MKYCVFSCILTSIIFSQIISYGQKKLTLRQMQEDFDQLSQVFKANHQGLYFYTDTLSTNQKIDSLRSTLSQVLEYRDFFNKIAALVALTNEGHTNLKYPLKDLLSIGFKKGFLPFGIFFCGKDKDAIIKSVYNLELKELKGKKVVSINGTTIKEIMATILPYIATDGFNTTSAYEWAAWSFPKIYYQLNGLSKSFKLEIEDIEGNKSIKTVYPISYKTIDKQSKLSEYLLLNGLFNNKTYKVVNDSVAYIALIDFVGKDKKIMAFYDSVFADLKKKKIQHLIIDIQRHVGGSEGVENLLTNYLVKVPFQKYKAVTIPMASYQKLKQKKVYQRDQWRLLGEIPHRGKFTLMSNYYAEHKFNKPKKNLIFEGKVYVLVSGVTFSGGAEFASMLKMQERAIFIGEEVGGAHEGNVSGHSKKIKLNHSGIVVFLPIVHFKLNTEPNAKGHGVKPDYYVPQYWKDLLNKINSKLNYTLVLIERNMKN